MKKVDNVAAGRYAVELVGVVHSILSGLAFWVIWLREIDKCFIAVVDCGLETIGNAVECFLGLLTLLFEC